ncbi:SPC25 [Symbiodinium sp. CCMP2592]|nr:SPC25 [Symbiodinium sp. CCMP2592]
MMKGLAGLTAEEFQSVGESLRTGQLTMMDVEKRYGRQVLEMLQMEWALREHALWTRGVLTDQQVIAVLGETALEVFQSHRLLHEQGTWAAEDGSPPQPDLLKHGHSQGITDVQRDMAVTDHLEGGLGVAPTVGEGETEIDEWITSGFVLEVLKYKRAWELTKAKVFVFAAWGAGLRDGSVPILLSPALRQERGSAISVVAQKGLQDSKSQKNLVEIDILREEDVLYDLQADLVAVEELTEVIAGTAELLQSAHEEYRKELRDEQKKLTQKKEAAHVQENGISDFLARYSRCLGLDIVRVTTQTVRLVFTLIDQDDPSREFSVVLGLGKEGYVASECSPQAPELPELLERLNEASPNAAAIPLFICGLRRAFASVA